MDIDSGLTGALAEHGAIRREQIRQRGRVRRDLLRSRKASFCRLLPFGIEIHDQTNQAAPEFRRVSASISRPSLRYFMRTLRAAMRAISQPRWPSRKPAPRT